jgi:hypothetical protein
MHRFVRLGTDKHPFIKQPNIGGSNPHRHRWLKHWAMQIVNAGIDIGPQVRIHTGSCLPWQTTHKVPLNQEIPPAILAHFQPSAFTPSNRLQLNVFGSLILGPFIIHITNHQFQNIDWTRPQALTMGGTESMHVVAIPLD